MLISTLKILASTFKMQQLFVICDLNIMSLGSKRSLFNGRQTINVGKSLPQLDLADSNVIICASQVGVDSLAVVYNTSMRHSWVIVHSGAQDASLSPSRIDQQLYFYNNDTNTLSEKYSVNSVVIERQLDLSHAQENVVERRSNLQGTTLRLLVAHWPPLFGVRRKDKIHMLPSQDEYFALWSEDTYGWLKDLLVIMARDLNFTFKLVGGPNFGTYRYHNDLFSVSFQDRMRHGGHMTKQQENQVE